jgi:hypothetical protein
VLGLTIEVNHDDPKTLPLVGNRWRLFVCRGWLWRHESGTYVKFTAAGAELLCLTRIAAAQNNSGEKLRANIV